MNRLYEKEYPELKKEDHYTSPASSLPLHELKMLQDYIHSANLQHLGAKLPNAKKQMILLKFFKSKKNQLVEVYSRNGEEVIHTVGKVAVVGRNFVMLKTLFTRYWIPFTSIHSAKTPFGLPDVPGSHQHVVIDQELRRKLLTNFGDTVASKEALRQQFFEELLETNLKSWKGTKLIILAGKSYHNRIRDIQKGVVLLKGNNKIPIHKIQYMKQTRMMSFIERIFTKWFKKL
ncbi:hypothetical protein [Lysinibacillus antri]|uniref:Uncharacterized protein n=1 Tax=Lysinibacillus antri TaxID=2498145 RepID=A0A432LGS2_9BACI|nr:hypothetical protein [Lysinibacillus antri]RUL55584.1 hypothetical protein EK386_04470 [Lysinibacillus antri]